MSFAVDNTLGAALIGFSVSGVVFGVLTTQVFTYFRRYPSDRVVYKLLVAILWSLELIDQTFIGHSVYHYTIKNYGNPFILVTGDVVWTLIVQVAIGALVGTIVKVCFAIRVWRFSDRNVVVTGIILLLVLAQFGCAIAYTVRAFQMNKFIYAAKIKTIATISLTAGLLTDVTIASALCFFLRKLRTGYKKSDSLVNHLTVYAINTGALTSTISLITLVLYNTNPEAFYFIASYFVLAKLYAISFLCTLNTRKIIRGRGTDRAGTSKTANIGNSNSFYMVTNHTGRTIMPSQSQAKSIEIGVVRNTSVRSDVIDPELRSAAQFTPDSLPKPSNELFN